MPVATRTRDALAFEGVAASFAAATASGSLRRPAAETRDRGSRGSVSTTLSLAHPSLFQPRLDGGAATIPLSASSEASAAWRSYKSFASRNEHGVPVYQC